MTALEDAPAPGATIIETSTDPPARREALRPRKQTWRQALRKDWQLYSLLVLPVVFLLIFRYIPMTGNVIAFRRFRPGSSMWGDEWVGLRYVDLFLGDPNFWRAFWNTLILGFLLVIVVAPLPIILALMLNEMRSRRLKRITQTISYLPHFMSIVVVAGIVLELTAQSGTINQVIGAFGGESILFMQEPGWFRPVFVTSEIWQTVGFGTILYLAAMTTIDDQLYEAAQIDGANRWKQTWHVTLPGIRPVIVVLMVLNIGQFMAVGFEKVLLLYTPLTYPTGDVIATYVYRVGLTQGQYSYGTAIGLFEAVIGLILVFTANRIGRRLTGSSLW